ncbi:MAG: hypothetical protein BMS9Abin36_0677 [Gammaproteobacteria bacterium]|nr:MAG: hypothetical protein BMS9Abin36_0677 [Gammaproteobacteria bacterium]
MKTSQLILTLALAGMMNIALAGNLSDAELTTFNSGDALSSTDMNANFDAAQADINDNDTRIGTNISDIGTNTSGVSGHDTRITALENAATAAGIGRLFVPIAMGSSTLGALPDAVSTSFQASFGKPADYVSGGSNDVTLKFLISGCGGTDIGYITSRSSYNIGDSNVGGLLIVFPPTSVLSIPANVSTGFFTYTYSVVEATLTQTGFGDQNIASFTRYGSDVLDTCAGTATLRGLIVEYPTQG